MQSSRTRLTCRAHNRFTPSVALWQHFIAPGPQQRLSSTAPQTPRQEATSSPQHVAPHEASQAVGNVADLGAVQHHPKPEKQQGQYPIRRLLTSKGVFLEDKRAASILKNQKALRQTRQASLNGPEDLLAVSKAAFDASEDYKGVAVAPMVNPNPVKESDLPWCLPREERTSMPAMDRLAAEMDKFCAYARPGRYEQIARDHVMEQVRRNVLAPLPQHTLELFGSERTGTALATSDIDFRLIRPNQISDPTKANLPPSPDQRVKGLRGLQTLYSKLRGKYVLTFLRYARYPLISLQDRPSGIDIQIVLANDTSESRKIMQRYMDDIPYLVTLFTVVKTIFDIRGLSDVFRGGFGSYSLFMMIVASIQQSPNQRNDAAGGLLNFLKFWRDFDTTKNGISIEPVELFDKTSVAVMSPKARAQIENGRAKPLPSYMLCLRDPADATNDLGRKGIAIKHVQATFESLLGRLKQDLSVQTRPTFLGPLVGPVYMLNLARRGKLEALGKRLALRTEKSLAEMAKAVREGQTLELTTPGDSNPLKEVAGSSQEEIADTAAGSVEEVAAAHGEEKGVDTAADVEKVTVTTPGSEEKVADTAAINEEEVKDTAAPSIEEKKSQEP
ncbi:hypothetical protein T440DRAFT_443296 [Plenodomus tracheiphilus IPT5]|uniref:Poly(A) RNA polymerase mitochondrial-like central palm domain-containing protein n=1 Tax=Plenodomus tracheiphilus IPT5 TaxID=1408161 RepID=A0A6A7BGP5_9PLEO|nr:hypothetical protein T440DRAFT_443296 [Plenodomus tracheiphilus IPT5]